MTDMAPFLCFFIAFNFDLLLRARPVRASVVAACLALLAGVSLFLNARASLTWGPVEWNYLPTNIDQDRTRFWDWRDPQPLRRQSETG
jgi:hypothetical protein